MKKTFAVALLLGTLAFAVAQSVSYNAWFTWSPNPANELVTGYRIEYQKLPAITNWTYIMYVPSTTNTALIKNLQPGYQYKFRAFAVNVIGIGTNQSDIVQIPDSSPTVVNGFSSSPK